MTTQPGRKAAPLTLSVLENAAAGEDVSGYDAIRQAVEVAMEADQLGYHRFWVTEHHAQATISSSAPAILAAHVAARTTHLRVGSGGVMLGNHPPIVVAEQFGTLEALHPGRIDLGIGGGSGAPDASLAFEAALGRTARSVSEYPARVDDLLGFVAGTFPASHRYGAIGLSPRVDPVPVYLLGAGEGGAGMAAERGLPFVFGYHLGRGRPAEVLSRYRASFRPSASSTVPYVIVSVNVLCARTDAEAEQLALALGLDQVRRRQAAEAGTPFAPGGGAGVPATLRELYLARKLLFNAWTVIGDPGTAARGLADLAAKTGADELMIVPIERDGAGRIRTLRLIAEGRSQGAAAATAPLRVTVGAGSPVQPG